MKRYRIALEAEAREQLAALEAYIAAEGSPEAGARFVAAILARCEALDQFPFRGTPRDDLYPGLRTLSVRGRATIAYLIRPDGVHIVGVAYQGRDLTSAFGSLPEVDG